jgi:hypothetical protein
MRKIAIALAASAAAATTLGIAGPASAATTVTVTNPASPGYTAVSGTAKLTDGSVNMTCTSSNAAGNLPSAHVTLPANVGTVTSLSFNSCSGPLGTVTTTVNSLPYNVTLAGWDTTNARATGYLGSVNVKVSMPLCNFVVTGNAPGYYVNSSHTLQVTPAQALPSGVTPLTVSAVSGCAGLVANGDHPTFTAAYAVSPAITVTTP